MISKSLNILSLFLRGILLLTTNIMATFMIAINRGPYWMDAGEWYAIWALTIIASINTFESNR